MTRYESLTDQIDENTGKLLDLGWNDAHAKALRLETADLLIERMGLTIGEGQEIVKETTK